MTAISITAANVKKGNNAQTAKGTAGVAVTAGQVVYLNAATGKLELADANTYAQASAKGIALHAAAADQPLEYQYGGEITIGGTSVVGTIFCVGATAGAIVPSADLTTGDYTCILGIGISATLIKLGVFFGGVVIP
jgi:hypothetical protein